MTIVVFDWLLYHPGMIPDRTIVFGIKKRLRPESKNMHLNECMGLQ